MIQPLKSSKTNWLLYWVDLEEPVPSGADYFLPTLLIVCDSGGTPLAPPEIMEEIDQDRVESFLLKLFDRLGTPDRLVVSASEDWDNDGWTSFSEECQMEIRFQNFGKRTPDELRALTRTIATRFGREASNPSRSREVARGLVNTALRMRSQHKKLALLRTALDRDADCSLARIELADADFQKGDWKACMLAYEEIITRDAPHWKGRNVEWWSHRETRPYLRAVYGKAMTLWHQGRHLEAAGIFRDLTALNKQDNQGSRFLVPMLYLLSEENEAAAACFDTYRESYPGDYAEPSFLFGWALSLGMEGREAEARVKYHEAMLKNIYIAPMLLELDEPPRNLWLPNDRAEPGYAGEFIESYAILWDREASALRLLREAWTEILPRIAGIVEHREKMSDFQDQRFEPDYKEIWQKMVAQDEALTTR